MNRQYEIVNNLPEHSAVVELLNQIQDLSSNEDDLFSQKYKSIVEDNRNNTAGHRPFLSIVTRTQGKRPEMLREMLLSLNGQTDENFEIILIGHRLDNIGEENVRLILQELGTGIKEKIRYFRVDYGNRTAPLNYGFACARGKYISILDDDDIVFDNWVEEFHKKAHDCYGKILHSYVLEQKWEIIKIGNGVGLRAIEEPKATFCRDFDIHEQVRMNHCPVMGLAFPSFYFKEMGMTFDETLTTTEDWDYLMRVAFIAGVEDIPIPTAIYRKWNNSDTSHDEHFADEWDRNYSYILDKMRDSPEIIPSGTDKLAVYDSQLENWTKKKDIEQFFDTNLLYLDINGRGYCEENTKTTEVLCDKKKNIRLTYDIPTETGIINAVRFDPCEKGEFCIYSLCVTVVFTDGNSKTVNECEWNNGFSIKNGVFFCGMDPQIILFTNLNEKLSSIEIRFSVSLDNLGNGIEEAINTEVEKRLSEKRPYGIRKAIILLRKIKVFVGRVFGKK